MDRAEPLLAPTVPTRAGSFWGKRFAGLRPFHGGTAHAQVSAGQRLPRPTPSWRGPQARGHRVSGNAAAARDRHVTLAMTRSLDRG